MEEVTSGVRDTSYASFGRLKRRLLEVAVDREVNALLSQPELSTVEKTVLLRLLRDHVVGSFPGCAKNQSIVDRCLVDTLARLDTWLPIKKTVQDITVNFFDKMFKTEDQILETCTQQGLQLRNLLPNREIGIAECLQVVLKANSLEELPTEFLDSLKDYRTKSVAHTFQELTDPVKLSKLETAYRLIPRRAIRTILRVINPVEMMSRLSVVFMARPLGCKNLLQHLYNVYFDSERLKRESKALQRSIDSNYCNKIRAWINERYQPNPSQAFCSKPVTVCTNLAEAKSQVLAILRDNTLQPKLNCRLDIGDKEFLAMKTFLDLEKQRRDVRAFIEIIGDPQLIRCIKQLLPVITQPLVSAYSASDVPKFLDSILECLQQVITLMKSNEQNEVKKKELELLWIAMEAEIFEFLKNLFHNGSDDITQLVQWISQVMGSSTKVIFLNKALKDHLLGQRFTEEDNKLIQQLVEPFLAHICELTRDIG